MSISGSVGLGGVNNPTDVRRVQSLLNDNRVKPRLRVDGSSGVRTVQAIRWFQERIIRLRNPDGRVDPAGRTWRGLNQRKGRNPVEAAPKPKSPNPEEKKEFREDRRKFVDPRVKETKTTTQIINSIYPHFRGTGAKVISGYLSDSDLFWKVNYHWEYLLWMLEHSTGLPMDNQYKRRIQSMIAALRSNPPRPDKGYRTSAAIGKPVDSSSPQVMTKRHKILAQQKRDFKKLTREAELMSKSRRSSSSFHLAAAPVAHPGTSKHSTGYALDIKGSAGTIKSVSKRLGATLVFDEKSHVHVEFKNSVKG